MTSTGSSGEDMGNFDGKDRRTSLYTLLDHVLQTAKEKFDKEKASNRDRQSWGRLLVNGVEAYAKLIQASQTDDLEKRVAALETKGELV